MKRRVEKKQSGLVAGVIILLILGLSTIVAAEEADTWQNQISIYGWFSDIDGTVQGPGGNQSDFTYEVSDIVDNLNMIFMGGYEGKYNKWSIIADVVYMDIGDSASGTFPGGTGTIDMDLASWVVTGAVGYELVRSDRGTLSAIAGARYLDVEVTSKLFFNGMPVNEVSGSEGLTDGIIGIRGSIIFNENWFLPYHADIGGGGSDLSWQLFAGIGYRLSWGDIKLGYRYLKYDLGDDKVMKDLILSGPALGVAFRF